MQRDTWQSSNLRWKCCSFRAAPEVWDRGDCSSWRENRSARRHRGSGLLWDQSVMGLLHCRSPTGAQPLGCWRAWGVLTPRAHHLSKPFTAAGSTPSARTHEWYDHKPLFFTESNLLLPHFSDDHKHHQKEMRQSDINFRHSITPTPYLRPSLPPSRHLGKRSHSSCLRMPRLNLSSPSYQLCDISQVTSSPCVRAPSSIKNGVNNQVYLIGWLLSGLSKLTQLAHVSA